MKTVSIVRDRGQLTIPDSIRQIVDWVIPMSAVTISVIKPDEIIITPHQRQINWDQIWENIRKSRAIKGKGNISAVEFLERDRNSH
jgi:bifunctional DNA-binding transcriptional regulator/antitoxin component of YhaV-PrlF toxin-antitoxin module